MAETRVLWRETMRSESIPSSVIVSWHRKSLMTRLHSQLSRKSDRLPNEVSRWKVFNLTAISTSAQLME
jgi:hypothetical protein